MVNFEELNIITRLLIASGFVGFLIASGILMGVLLK